MSPEAREALLLIVRTRPKWTASFHWPLDEISALNELVEAGFIRIIKEDDGYDYVVAVLTDERGKRAWLMLK